MSMMSITFFPVPYAFWYALTALKIYNGRRNVLVVEDVLIYKRKKEHVRTEYCTLQSVRTVYCKVATDELRFSTVLVKILVKSSYIKVSECDL